MQLISLPRTLFRIFGGALMCLVAELLSAVLARGSGGSITTKPMTAEMQEVERQGEGLLQCAVALGNTLRWAPEQA